MRRVGALMNLAADDPVSIARAKAFTEGLQALGWIDGRNMQIDYRWAASKPDLFQRHAAELATLAPDVILAAGGAALPAVLQATRTISVVFVHTPDPIGSGFVASMARPGGNATGFLTFEYNLAAKWVELLKEIAPNRHTRWDSARCCRRPGDRAVRRNSVRCTVAWCGRHADQCTRCRRD